jgi:hypothetical protein
MATIEFLQRREGASARVETDFAGLADGLAEPLTLPALAVTVTFPALASLQICARVVSDLEL